MKRCAQCIARDVADSFGVRVGDLIVPNRTRRYTYPRFALFRLLRKNGLSYPQIGRMVGHRDHSTVISGIARADELIMSDPEFACAYERAAG